MSLRRRITGAVAIGVTAVVLILALFVYFSVRSHLRNEIDSSLIGFAGDSTESGQTLGNATGGTGATNNPAPFPYGPFGRGGGGGGFFRGPPGYSHGRPPDADFGGAGGDTQLVNAKGTVTRYSQATIRIPVTAAAKKIADSGSGRMFADQTVQGVHLRVLTQGIPGGGALQVARPLTETDNVLHSLLETFAFVIAAGIILAALMGAFIGRTALAPIGRFIRRTETVSGDLNRAERLEESDAEELKRLAASFNRTLDALEASVAAQRHLVADASHELRTPIAALRSNVQIFLERDRLPREEQEGLQTAILAELDELTQLVDDVLALGRGAAERGSVEEMRLDTIVTEAIERTRRRAPELRYEADLEPTMIAQVPERVARAVTNLLDNARKWSPPDGAIEVALHNGVLTVRDHGPGFQTDDIPHVFDRFYRAERARTMAGSGLGLAIVRQTAEAGGGFAQAGNADGGGALLTASFGAPIQAPAVVG